MNRQQPRTYVNRDKFLAFLKTKGYNERTIAEAINRSPKTIQRGITSGQLLKSTVLEICDVLGMSYGKFIGHVI